MKIVYIAGPLFTSSQRDYLEKINNLIKNLGFETYLPHKDGGLFIRSVSKSVDFFNKDIEGINKCNILIAVLNGNDVDSGTAWEMGFAYAKKIPIIGILEDSRKPHDDLLNPMISNSTIKITRNLEELKEELEKLKD